MRAIGFSKDQLTRALGAVVRPGALRRVSASLRALGARALAAALATLLFWTPLAPPIAHAYTEQAQTPSEAAALDGAGGVGLDPSFAGAALPAEELRPAAAEGLEMTVPPIEGVGQTVSDESATPLSLPGVEARTAVSPQAIQLPDAEGSVQGMGESFSPILSSGTATFSVPIAVAPGRHGVQPSLALSYSSTNGNGPVGFGWGLGAPFISRQEDRGLPRYVDQARWHPREDRFIYNGGQELVPVDAAAVAAADARAAPGAGAVPPELAAWQQYRARVEGAFMRFFRSPDSTRWVVQSRDGTRFDFGLLPSGEGPPEVVSGSVAALEEDPEAPAGVHRAYRWCLTRMSDAHGSTVYYGYRQDGGQAYLSDIHYTSPHACASGSTPEARRACASPLSSYGARVHLVYASRPDVFTSYATGWRIDTALRLARVEVTAWNDASGGRTLVRRYHLRYEPSSFHSLLAELQVEGRPDVPVASLGADVGDASVSEGSLGDAVVGRLLPAMRFGYSSMPASADAVPGFGGLDPTVHAVEASPPHSVDEARADLFDVNSDGLADLIVTDPARYATSDGQPAVGVFFNGFDGAAAMPAGRTAHFSGAVPVPMDPGLSRVLSLSNLNIVPMDIDGDGRSDLLHMPRARSYGFFTPARAVDGPVAEVVPSRQGWRWAYGRVDLPADDLDPRIDLGRDSSHLEIVDVNNDHLIDVVRTTGTVMQTWVNLGWLPGGDGRFGSYLVGADGSAQLSTLPYESCVLQSGTPIDFEDPGVRLADMNGDGLLDIVEMMRGRVRYWPGRGVGSWGAGPHDCPRGAGAGRYVEMGTPPAELNVELDGVSLMDVNADGASDVVQIRFDAVDVWFNEAGRGFTRRLIARGTPPTPSYSPRTRFADIDGSGTTDIVWGVARNWQYVDLAGGRRPRLLVQVENGLGAETDIAYGSSAEDYVSDLAGAMSCPTCDRFSWGAADEASQRLRRLSGQSLARPASSPVISTVVRQVRTSDRLDLVGRTAQVSQSSFAYHDGYYEGIEQEFRGFGAADARTEGDWNHPTSLARTFFRQGRRRGAIADDRLADNPDEALKGREYLTESFDERGVYLSSAHGTLAIRELLRGLDGRAVSYAFVREANELRYDTAVWSPGTGTLSLDDVVRESYAGGTWSPVASTPRTMRVRGALAARIRTTYDDVDALGQVRRQTAHGHVGLDAAAIDEPITSVSVPALLDGARWLWRTASTWIEGAGGRLRQASSSYDPATGDLFSTVQAVGAMPAYGFGGEPASEGGAPALAQDPSALLGSTRYDAWGNALASCVGADISGTADAPALPAGCLRYARVSYDGAYDQLAVTESAQVSPTLALGSTGTWDRGLGALTSATDPNGLVTSVSYDGLGRLTAVVPPATVCPGGTPSVHLRYELGSPVSRVVTTTELGCTLGASTLEAVGYVDGLGRARASLSTGDTPGQWIRSGITTLDAKGTVRRTYQPDFFAGSTTLRLPSQGA